MVNCCLVLCNFPLSFPKKWLLTLMQHWCICWQWKVSLLAKSGPRYCHFWDSFRCLEMDKKLAGYRNSSSTLTSFRSLARFSVDVVSEKWTKLVGCERVAHFANLRSSMGHHGSIPLLILHFHGIAERIFRARTLQPLYCAVSIGSFCRATLYVEWQTRSFEYGPKRKTLFFDHAK